LSATELAAADVLGQIAAEVRAEFQAQARRDLDQLRNEAKLAIAEIRCAALEVLLEARDPQVAAK